MHVLAVCKTLTQSARRRRHFHHSTVKISHLSLHLTVLAQWSVGVEYAIASTLAVFAMLQFQNLGAGWSSLR